MTEQYSGPLCQDNSYKSLSLISDPVVAAGWRCPVASFLLQSFG